MLGRQAQNRILGFFDGAGAFASFLCLIHCVGIPILLAAFPTLTFGVFQAESFHKVAAFVAGGLALAAFAKGFRAHRSMLMVGLGAVGAACLIFAAWGPYASLEKEITIGGSFLLIAAHLLNYRRARECSHPHHAHGSRHSHTIGSRHSHMDGSSHSPAHATSRL